MAPNEPDLLTLKLEEAVHIFETSIRTLLLGIIGFIFGGTDDVALVWADFVLPLLGVEERGAAGAAVRVIGFPPGIVDCLLDAGRNL